MTGWASASGALGVVFAVTAALATCAAPSTAVPSSATAVEGARASKKPQREIVLRSVLGILGIDEA